MNTSMLRTALGSAAAIALVVLPASAAAEYLVPPGNSAAIQYTETYPSAGGQKDAENQRGNRDRAPEKVLGEQNARRLQEHSPEGEAVAEVVAETAPTVAVAPETSNDEDSEEAGAGDSRGGGTSGSSSGDQGRPGSPGGISADIDQSGSSGLGEVLASAVGAPAGAGAGIVLPLAFLGTLAWAFAHLLRQRNRQSA